MSNGAPMDVAVATLAAFIRTSIPALTVKEEWPYANEKLVYPSLTITTGNPKRTPYSTATQLTLSTPDIDGKVTTTEVIAEWDDTFQLDLWTRDKNERRIFTDKIVDLFGSQWHTQGVDGLSLVMSGNFAEICRYTIDVCKVQDDEAAAERQERRQLFKILVNCNEVRQRSYYAIKSLIVYDEVDTGSHPLTDDTDNTDTTVIF